MSTTPRVWKALAPVNTAHSAAMYSNGRVSPLEDGGYLVVWQEESHINSGSSSIFAQRFDPQGNHFGGAIKVSQFASGEQFAPAVSTLADGSVAVAYVDRSAGNQNIFVHIVTPTATSLSLGRQDSIETGADFTQDPSITSFTDGSYVVTYTTGAADTDIVAKIVSPLGMVGAAFDVENDTDNRRVSDVATLANGDFVVVYQDKFEGSPTNHQIKYRIFDQTGGMPTHSGTITSPWVIETAIEPDVAALSSGGFVVSWTDANNDIRASVFHGADYYTISFIPKSPIAIKIDYPYAPSSSNILVNTTTIGSQNESNIIALPDGDFIVNWEDDSANVVNGQRFDASGRRIGTEFTVKIGASPLDSPDAALLSDGRIAYALGDASGGDFNVLSSIWDPRTQQDFNADGFSDYLWQHENGQIAVWLENGRGAKLVGINPGPHWHLKGSGDFNRDGFSDYQWQHENGQAAVWLENGRGAYLVGPNPGASWHLKESGDFNGDGFSDYLWQHENGQAAVWLENGRGADLVGPNPGAAWHVIGAGDFNRDGKSDILWQHENGQAAMWLMNGTIAIGWNLVGPNPGASWHLKGSGDFNGDGFSDYLWQHEDGQAAVWLENGLGGDVAGPSPGASWRVIRSGDFNGDGNSDILWQHDDGQAAVWLMNGTTAIGWQLIGTNPGPSWHLI